jgi:catechol 2,3-dioxygenase-like lactoylglutathione lyase family enzyme
MKASLRAITAMIPAGGSLDEAIRFYTEELGFSVVWKAGDMAGIARDEVGFNLVVNTNREWADNASFSIAVTDIDALYAEYGRTSARVGPLEEKSWGRREFHMIVPAGVCLQFYQTGT